MLKRIRIRTLVIGSVILSVIPLILLLILLFSYSVARNRQFENNLTEKNEESVLSSLASSVSEIQKRVDRLISGSNYLFFTNSSEEERVSRLADELISALWDDLQIYPEVTGIILYHNQEDRFYHAFTDLQYSADMTSVRTALTALPNEREHALEVLVVNEKPCILYRVSQRYGCAGILLNPEKNTVFRSLEQTLTKGERCFFSVEAENQTNQNIVVKKYPDQNLYINFIQPKNRRSTLDNLQTGILIVLCVFVGIISLIWFNIQLHLLSPLNALSSAFEEVSNGDLQYRLQSQSKLPEINRIYDSFNGMLDSISEAEEESHRQRMDAVQAKLQYLQLQIRPHFYLNCLKNINSLAGMHEDEKIQDLVIFLSDYFRYNFQDVKNFVTIREELEAVQSYVNLCRCLYYHLDLSVDIQNAVLQVKCLPMTVLTFVENCIKHGGEIEMLRIRISASVRFNDEEEPEAAIEIRNNGAFSEDALQELNEEASGHSFTYRKDHVGISNVRYRMYLIYEDRASVRFLNKNGDAVVQIIFPVENIDSIGESS